MLMQWVSEKLINEVIKEHSDGMLINGKICVTGRIFNFYSNFLDFESVLYEFDSVNDPENYKVLILHVSGKTINRIISAQTQEIKKESDYMFFCSEKDTFLFFQKSMGIGISLISNSGNDEWGSPIIEQIFRNGGIPRYAECDKGSVGIHKRRVCNIKNGRGVI